MKPVENCCRHAFSFLKSKAQSDENRNEQSRQSNHQEEEDDDDDDEGRRRRSSRRRKKKSKGGKIWSSQSFTHTYIYTGVHGKLVVLSQDYYEARESKNERKTGTIKYRESEREGDRRSSQVYDAIDFRSVDIFLRLFCSWRESSRMTVRALSREIKSQLERRTNRRIGRECSRLMNTGRGEAMRSSCFLQWRKQKMVGIRNDWHEVIISDDDKKRYPIYLDGQLSLSRRANCKCRFLLTRRANASERDSVWLSCPDVACAWKYSSNYLIRTHQFLSFILISDMSPPTSTISTVPAAAGMGEAAACLCAFRRERASLPLRRAQCAYSVI